MPSLQTNLKTTFQPLNKHRLAVICSHPIQYYAPWFQHIAHHLDLRVFYLWDFGVTNRVDRTFDRQIQWDIPLLEGYESEFVPNMSRDPGTHHFRGLVNPELPARIRRFDPDAALVFGYAWQSMLMFLLRHPRSLPVLIRGDSHLLCPPRPTLSSRARRLITRYALSRCDAALAVGSANRDFYLQSGFASHRVFHVPHCVDNERFTNAAGQLAGVELRNQLNIPQSAVLFSFVGKFEHKKRPDLLIRAFRDLHSPDAHLLLVGDGSLKPELLELASGDRRIHFLGFQNQTEIPAIYSAIDVLVLPSQGNLETWGLVVNEAMNCDCAVIVSSHVGCGADLVRTGFNGWIFEAGSQASLLKSLSDAVSGRERLKQFAMCSRGIIREYSYSVATERLLESLSSLLLSRR